MTLTESLGLSDTHERVLVRALQLVLLGVFVYGAVTLRFGMAANGAFSLAVTLLPAVLRREYGYTMDAGLVLWLTVTVVLHSLGSMGPYQDFAWYDSVTHTLTATFIAGVGYATLRAFEVHSDEIDLPSRARVVFVVVFVLAAGVVWEVTEFASGRLATILGADAPLVVYGIDDIVTDFVFNTVGALIVAIWASEDFRGLAGFFRRRLRRG